LRNSSYTIDVEPRDCTHSGYSWFALRVRSHYENATVSALRGRGYEEFLPLYRSLRRWPSRTKMVELPLFPGYVFCRFDPTDRLPILTIPGVVNILGVGKVPAPVNTSELTAIRAIVASRLAAGPWPFVDVGERVLVVHGPLRGLEGIVVALKRNYRLVVSVTLLQRSVAVEIDRAWTRPAQHSGCSLPCARVEAAGGSKLAS
jgi:transcription antitermination factor NusG